MKMFSRFLSILSMVDHPLLFRYTTASKRLILKRQSSVDHQHKQTMESLTYISALTDYVNRQMFLFVPEQPKGESVTTSTLLDQCTSVKDVLQLVGNMNGLGKLWNEELQLYFTKLTDFTKDCSRDNDLSPMLSEILNHENFHLLLRKTVISSLYLKSTDLVHFFNCAGKLMVPAESFVISNTIEVMKKRINDFFPQDVAVCDSALRTYAFCTPQMRSLSSGLLLHLENMAGDEPFFVKTTAVSGIATILYLSRFFASEASPILRNALIECVAESVRLQKESKSFDTKSALNTLASLSLLQYNDHRVIDKSIDAILRHKDQLFPDQKLVLINTLGKLEIKQDKMEMLQKLISDNSLLSSERIKS